MEIEKTLSKNIGYATEKDDRFQEILDEFEQIRSCIGMYISKLGTDGALHIVKEILNNAIDECVNIRSDGNEIIVRFDENITEFSVQDNGRGIPFDRMVDCCTKKHTSTKIDRTADWVKGLAGRNGVGLVVTTATSSLMKITSFRDGYYKCIKFIDGKLNDTEDIGKISSLPNGEDIVSGTVVDVIPSEKYLGVMNVTSDLVEDYLRCMSYTLPEHITLHYVATLRDTEVPYTRSFKREGLENCVKYFSQNTEFEPITISVGMNKPEDGTYINFDLEMSFSYDKHLVDSIIDSYCNYIHTTEGGNHESVAKAAICNFFSREARKLDENSKYEVLYDDCKRGLILAVNCMHVDPAFEGQHKTRVSNSDVNKYGKSLFMSGLEEYFDKNKATLRKIVQYLRTIAKARMESEKIKGVSQKKMTTFLDEVTLTNFYPLRDRNYLGYREIYFAEGLSAGSQLNTVRNNMYQAILCMRGPINNVTNMTYATMITKEICKAVVDVLGCGAGPTFDITKLKWTKIIIMTDADVDGSNLASLLINFIWRFMPDLILSGKVYIAMAPFYLLDSKQMKKMTKKDSHWVYNISEYYDIINKSASQNITLYYPDAEDGRLIKLSEQAVFNWLKDNNEYLIELDALRKRTFASPTILETVCYAKLKHPEDELAYSNYVLDLFPEVAYDLETQTFSGSHNGRHINLIADDAFFSVAKRFMKKLTINSHLLLGVKNKNDKNDNVEIMTISEILDMVKSKIVIQIEERFKGLGETKPYILFLTTMNPKMRKLKRLTVNNINELTQLLDNIHGDSKQNIEWRRQLLSSEPISYLDIDN